MIPKHKPPEKAVIELAGSNHKHNLEHVHRPFPIPQRWELSRDGVLAALPITLLKPHHQSISPRAVICLSRHQRRGTSSRPGRVTPGPSTQDPPSAPPSLFSLFQQNAAPGLVLLPGRRVPAQVPLLRLPQNSAIPPGLCCSSDSLRMASDAQFKQKHNFDSL